MKWEYFGTGLAFLGIGITLVLALPPPWWPNMPRWVIRTGLFLGLAFIVYGVALTAMGIWPESLRPKLLPILVICAGASLVISGSVWFFRIPSAASVPHIREIFPVLRLASEHRDIRINWPPASIFPQADDKDPPLTLKLGNLGEQKATNVELAFKLGVMPEEVIDALKKAAIFPALKEGGNNELELPLDFVLGKSHVTSFVGFQGENVRRIPILDSNEVSIAYPPAIQNIIWLKALADGFAAGQRIDAEQKEWVSTLSSSPSPEEFLKQGEERLRERDRQMTLNLPTVEVRIKFTSPDGRVHEQTERIRAVYKMIASPFWAWEDERREKQTFRGGMGVLAFEDKDNPDDGLFAEAKRQGIIPTP